MSADDPLVLALVSKPVEGLSFEDGGRVAKAYLLPILAQVRAIKGKPDASSRALEMVRGALAPVAPVRALAKAHPAFDHIVAEVCLNQIRRPATVGSKLADLTEEEGATIGTQLTPSLLSNAASDEAVAEWMAKHPALKELKEEHEWTEAMFQGVAKELVKQSSMGARFRLYTGAGLSIMDLFTDTSMINQYMNTPGQEEYGYALMAMVGGCLLSQLLVVGMNNRKGTKQQMAKEMLIVLTAVKPGVDAYRVAEGRSMPESNFLGCQEELGE
jgi:hypothetical protein